MKIRVMLAVLMLALFSTSTSFAADIFVDTVTSMSTTGCVGSTITTFFSSGEFAGKVDDDGMVHDYISSVLYDGNGNAFAWGWAYASVGSTYTLPFLIQNNVMAMPVSRPFTLKIYDITFDGSASGNLTNAQTGALKDTVTFDPASLGVCTSLSLTVDPTPTEPSTEASADDAVFTDGRINNRDMANPIVAYGHEGETGRGLVIYSPYGELLLVVSAEEIAEVAECPTESTLIASAGVVELYRVEDCRYMLIAPSLDGAKTYVLLFGSLFADGDYTSYEVEN